MNKYIKYYIIFSSCLLLSINSSTAQFISNSGFENYGTSAARPSETIEHLLTDHTQSPTTYYLTDWMYGCNNEIPALLLKEGSGSPFNNSWQAGTGSFANNLYKFPNGVYTSNGFIYDCNNLNENAFLSLSNDNSLVKFGANVRGTFQTPLDLFKYYTIKVDVALPTSSSGSGIPNAPFEITFRLLDYEATTDDIYCAHSGDLVYPTITLTATSTANQNCGWVTYEATFNIIDIMEAFFASNAVVALNPNMSRSSINDYHMYDYEFWTALGNGSLGPYTANPYFATASQWTTHDFYDFKKYFELGAVFYEAPLFSTTGLIFLDNVRIEEQNCYSDLLMEETISDGGSHVYEAQNIVANNTVNNSSTVVYKADNSILLTEDFLITRGSYGLFYIAPCTGHSSYYNPLARPLISANANAENAIAEELKIFPNPTQSQVTIQLGLETETDLYVDLYNISGQRVKQLLSAEHRTAGAHQFQIALDEVPAGVYFVRVQTAEHVISKELVIVR